MLVHHDLVVPLLGQQRQQALGVHGLCAGLAQVQQIQPFLEECIYDSVFLYEEISC